MASIEYDKQPGSELHISTSGQQFDIKQPSGCSYEAGIECAPNVLQLDPEDGLEINSVEADSEIGLLETVEQLLTTPVDAVLKEDSDVKFPITENNMEAMVDRLVSAQRPEIKYVDLPTIASNTVDLVDEDYQHIPTSVRRLSEEIGIDSLNLTTDEINAMMRSVAHFYNSQFPTGYNGEKGEEQYEAMIRNCAAEGLPMPNGSKEEIIHDLTHNSFTPQRFIELREPWTEMYVNEFPRFVDEMMKYYQVADRQELRKLLLTLK